MGGKNPYIEQETKFTLPTKKYKVTFVEEEGEHGPQASTVHVRAPASAQ